MTYLVADSALYSADNLQEVLGNVPEVDYSDPGYMDWIWTLGTQREIRLEITKCAATAQGFRVIPRRWIVERTLGWVKPLPAAEQRV